MKKLILAATAIALIACAAPAMALAGGHEGAEAAAHHGAGHAPEINWISFSPSEGQGPPMAIALVNFAILIFLLVKLFGRSFTSFLQTRHDSIKTALEEGKRLREEAQQRLEEYGRKIANVDREVDELVASIRAAAEEEKARILAQAEAQAAALEREAQDRIAAEIERSRRALEREVVGAAVAAAEKLLRDKTRDDDQRRLADNFVAELQKSTSTSAGDSVDDSW